MKINLFFSGILLSIFLFAAHSLQAIEIDLGVEKSENPFPVLVRLLPCASLEEKFKSFCGDKARESKNLQEKSKWEEHGNNSLETLRGYVKDYLDKNGTKKLLVGCNHNDERRSCVSTSAIGSGTLCRRGENHKHKDYVTVTSQYMEYKKGTLFVFPYEKSTVDSFLIDERGATPVAVYVLDNVKDLNTDFIGLYPFGNRAKDFPKNYFKEIYMERARFERGLTHYHDNVFELIFSQLAPGGKLVTDYDGEPVSISLFKGAEIKEGGDGNLVIYINPKQHNYQALCKQLDSFFEEPWAYSIPAITLATNQVLDGNKEFLKSIWNIQADKTILFLEKFGFVNIQAQFDVVNPINKRRHSRLLLAYKDK